jgi:hypothetical protein
MCLGRWFAVLFMRSPMRWFYGFAAEVLRGGFMRLKVNAVKTSAFLGRRRHVRRYVGGSNDARKSSLQPECLDRGHG